MIYKLTFSLFHHQTAFLHIKTRSWLHTDSTLGRKSAHLGPALVPYANDHVPLKSSTTEKPVGLSLSATCYDLNLMLFSLYLIHFLLIFSTTHFGTLSEDSPCKSFTITSSLLVLMKLPPEAQDELSSPDRKSFFLIYRILSSMFNSFNTTQDINKFSSETEFWAFTVSEVQFSNDRRNHNHRLSTWHQRIQPISFPASSVLQGKGKSFSSVGEIKFLSHSELWGQQSVSEKHGQRAADGIQGKGYEALTFKFG